MAERGKLLWEMQELPYAMAEINEQNIMWFSEDKYRDADGRLFVGNRMLENGHASERGARIAEVIKCRI